MSDIFVSKPDAYREQFEVINLDEDTWKELLEKEQELNFDEDKFEEQENRLESEPAEELTRSAADDICFRAFHRETEAGRSLEDFRIVVLDADGVRLDPHSEQDEQSAHAAALRALKTLLANEVPESHD